MDVVGQDPGVGQAPVGELGSDHGEEGEAGGEDQHGGGGGGVGAPRVGFSRQLVVIDSSCGVYMLRHHTWHVASPVSCGQPRGTIIPGVMSVARKPGFDWFINMIFLDPRF